MPVLDLPIAEIAEKVQKSELKASDLVKEALQNLEKASDYDAIISFTKERATKRAKEIDNRIAKGEKIGPLAGVPFVAKDNFLTFGSKTTAASNMLKDYEAPYRAAAPADRRLSWRLMLCPSPLVLTLAVPSANQPVFVAALVINRLMGWYLVPAWFPWPAAPILLAPWREGLQT